MALREWRGGGEPPGYPTRHTGNAQRLADVPRFLLSMFGHKPSGDGEAFVVAGCLIDTADPM